MQVIRACINLATILLISYIKESRFKFISGMDQYVQIMIWHVINY